MDSETGERLFAIDLYTDELPQPYRLIDEILHDIIDDAVAKSKSKKSVENASDLLADYAITVNPSISLQGWSDIIGFNNSAITLVILLDRRCKVGLFFVGGKTFYESCPLEVWAIFSVLMCMWS
jgi:hypothetical protein